MKKRKKGRIYGKHPQKVLYLIPTYSFDVDDRNLFCCVRRNNNNNENRSEKNNNNRITKKEGKGCSNIFL